MNGMNKQLFAGLIFDENDNPVETDFIGSEAVYIVNDSGFRRHIPAIDVDRQVLAIIQSQIKGNEELITQQTTKMLGQDDLFSHAVILNQIKQIGNQFETLLKTGIPEEGRAYMGMLGFKITINVHGEVVRLDQPTTVSGENEDE